MNTAQSFATTLLTLLGSDTAVRIREHGSMPLSIEVIGRSSASHCLIALSHTWEQNGDVIRDPKMVFELVTDVQPAFAEPLSF
jgi:hypothetical protein